jgi:hypothetical protein
VEAYPEPNYQHTTETPSFAQIDWLKDLVLRCGGRAPGRVCRPKALSYPAGDGVRKIMVNTCGCGNDTLVSLPYRTDAEEDEEVSFCLVCDGALDWPRLNGEDPGEPADLPPHAPLAGVGPMVGDAKWARSVAGLPSLG